MKSKFPLFLIVLALLFSCHNETVVDDDQRENEDYREEFVGTYDCIKNTSTIEVVIEVVMDSTSSDKIFVGSDLVPISTDGNYGPENLRPDYNYEIRFVDDEIYIRSHRNIINGIALPCVFTGTKRE